jgi:hypothetical protein
MNRIATWLAAALLASTSGCAAAAAQREAQQRLERAVGPYRYLQPEEEVWDAVRRLLADEGMKLAGQDAEAVGQPVAGLLAWSTAARETAALPGGGRSLETDWRKGGVRYRAELRPGPRGAAVVFTRITEDANSPRHDGLSRRDPALELELVRRLSPEAAAAIEAQAGLAPTAPSSERPVARVPAETI